MTPVLGPLALAILALVGFALGGTYVLETRHIGDLAQDQLSEVGQLFEEHLADDSRLLMGFAGLVSRDSQLQRMWLARDRAALLERSQPIFEELRSEYQITHFYFHGPDRVCFQRVHTPDRHGDYIDRATLDAAVRTGRPCSGIELGPLGTFATGGAAFS